MTDLQSVLGLSCLAGQGRPVDFTLTKETAMKLYVSPRAPNPRRVTMFIAEKNIEGIEEVIVNLSENEHKTAAYVARNPFSGVPTLELDDGRVLSESRAICTYLEGLHPQPNLMGTSFEERAFIEMADRRMELALFGAVANCIRHTHPGLSALEQPQFHDFGQSQGEKMLVVAHWLDQHLASSNTLPVTDSPSPTSRHFVRWNSPVV